MRASSSIFRALIAGLALCGAGAWTSLAHAEEEFPGALAEAADMACVPTCLMCHTVNPGTQTTWSGKPLGLAIGTTIGARAGFGDVAAFNKAWALYAGNPMNAAAVASIQKGVEPKLQQNVCSPTYGCGATFAHTPSRGLPGSSAAVVAALSLAAGLWVARRRR